MHAYLKPASTPGVDEVDAHVVGMFDDATNQVLKRGLEHYFSAEASARVAGSEPCSADRSAVSADCAWDCRAA